MLASSSFFRESSNMSRDALSRTLELVDARAIYAGGFIGGGEWSIRFPSPGKVKFFVVGRGTCLLAVDGCDSPFPLAAGDALLLTRDAGFTVASDLSLSPRSAAEVYAGQASVIISVGEGDDFLLLGGHIDTDSAGGRLMIEGMPPVLHLSGEENRADRLGVLIAELVKEAASNAPGAEMACASLAHLLLIQILRRHLASDMWVSPGWLRVANDPRLAPALALMHGDMRRAWTLPELARAAAMSRTAFATHFRAVAGMPPLAYLTEWRMRHADRELRRAGSSVAKIAQAVGYGSEAAFSTAFKRVMGRSPRHDAWVSASDASRQGPV